MSMDAASLKHENCLLLKLSVDGVLVLKLPFEELVGHVHLEVVIDNAQPLAVIGNLRQTTM